jgi:hypothetical protein
MSVLNPDYTDIYTAAGTTGPYPITFDCILDISGNAQDILVQVVDSAGATTDITSTSTITGLNVYTAIAYDATNTIVLVRYPDVTQPYTFPYGTKFPSKTFENALDRLAFLVQRGSGDADLALKAPFVETPTPPNRLPTIADRANHFLGFDSGGQPIAADPTSVPVTPFMQTVLDDVTSEEARLTLKVHSMTVITSSTTISDIGSYRISGTGIVVSIDSTGWTAGNMVEIFADDPCIIAQTDAEHSIEYRHSAFTTKGVAVLPPSASAAGFIQLGAGDFIRMFYKGNGTSRIEPGLKITNPTNLPAGEGKGCAWTTDGVYFAVAHMTTPFITIYKRSGDTFTKLTDPTSLPTGDATGCAFSADGTYLAVSHGVSRYVTIYKRTSGTDTWVKITDPGTLPTGAATSCAFSANGLMLAVGHATTPFVTVYRRTAGTDTWVKMTNPGTLPAGTVSAVEFTRDGTLLMVGQTGTSTVLPYRIDGAQDTLTVLTAITTGTAVYAIACSSDDKYILVGTQAGGAWNVHKKLGSESWALLVAAVGISAARGAAISFDGRYFAIAQQGGSPYINWGRKLGDSFTMLSAPATVPAGLTNGLAFSFDGMYLAITHATSPYVTIYKNTEAVTKQWCVSEFSSKDAVDPFYKFR